MSSRAGTSKYLLTFALPQEGKIISRGNKQFCARNSASLSHSISDWGSRSKSLLIDFRSETSGAQFFAALQTELNHRVQVAAKAVFGHT
jgi:hypothetical protein